MHDPLKPPYPSLLLPAEWEAQRAVWYTWPQSAATWTPVWDEARAAYREILRASVRFQDVHVLVDDEARRDRLAKEFAPVIAEGPHRLEFLVYRTNDSWIRDYGALTVRAPDGTGKTRLVALDFTFNSWGGKYPPWDRDDAAPRFMADARKRECLTVDFVLEGGSIDVNGQGLLLTSEQCLLNKNRNPQLTREQIERNLRDFLGVKTVLWVGDGILGDDTDGHIDDITRFYKADGFITCVEPNKRDANHQILEENLERLRSFRTPAGRKFCPNGTGQALSTHRHVPPASDTRGPYSTFSIGMT